MDQQFSLSWNNFHGNLSKGFAGLLGKGEFVDVTLAVEGHLLQAHKVILSICSPYFKKMFQMNPCQHPIVVLRDVTLKAMKDLLQFMYQGEVSVKREDLTNFIGTAEVLQIKGLTHKEAEEEDNDKINELSRQNLGRQNDSPDLESSISDNIDSSPNEALESSDLDLLQQRQFIEKVQRLSQLKRKSEEFLHKAYFSDILNAEKRPKVDDKIVYSNYDNFKNVYEESPINITTTLNTSIQKTSINKEISDNRNEKPMSTNSIEVKTECDDVDIIATENAVCTTPNTNEGCRESKNTSSVALDYQSPQDSALSLVVNGSSINQSLPVRYKYIYSRKGHKQLVHMNFVYTKHSTTHGKTSWRCVQYFSLNRCPATVETIDTMIYAVNHEHNHEDCYEKLSRNNIYEMNGSSK